MKSLENSLFFVVNRLFLKRIKMYLSFNIEMIPRSLEIRKMILHAPLNHMYPDGFSVIVQEILENWSEERIRKGRKPSHDVTIARQTYPAGQHEVLVDLSAYAKKWRRNHKENHGVYLKIKNADQLYFSKRNPPFLEIVTTKSDSCPF